MGVGAAVSGPTAEQVVRESWVQDFYPLGAVAHLGPPREGGSEACSQVRASSRSPRGVWSLQERRRVRKSSRPQMDHSPCGSRFSGVVRVSLYRDAELQWEKVIARPIRHRDESCFGGKAVEALAHGDGARASVGFRESE
ncbi:hypothetical protein CLOM_g6446 [Closterium sp. NIES-68]|nr:hypothetical protein CLOM_g6446 [Closterium sp. NIES-68]